MFATLLSRQPYYVSVDPARPPRARLCSWSEFEILVLAEDNQPSSPQRKDVPPTNTNLGAASEEKRSPLQVNIDTTPTKNVSTEISPTHPEKNSDRSTHPPPSKQTPIRQSTLPNPPTQPSRSPPLKPHRQKTVRLLVNGTQSNGPRKMISLPKISLVRFWKRPGLPSPFRAHKKDVTWQSRQQRCGNCGFELSLIFCGMPSHLTGCRI